LTVDVSQFFETFASKLERIVFYCTNSKKILSNLVVLVCLIEKELRLLLDNTFFFNDMHWSGLWGENHGFFREHPSVAFALKLPGFLVVVGRFVDTRDYLFEAWTCLAYAECRLLKAKHI